MLYITSPDYSVTTNLYFFLPSPFHPAPQPSSTRAITSLFSAFMSLYFTKFYSAQLAILNHSPIYAFSTKSWSSQKIESIFYSTIN